MKVRHGWWRADEGRVSLFFAIIAPVLLLLIAVVVDGGGQIRAMQQADNLAAQAARAAGQAIDLPTATDGGTKQVNPAAALAAANAYLTAAHATGTITIQPDRQHVAVTTTITYRPALLGVFGSGPVVVHGHAVAQLVTG